MIKPLSSSVYVDLDIVPPTLREGQHVDDIYDD